MIDGLKLTMTGAELIGRLDERIASHEASDARDDSRRARVAALTLIRDHILTDEVYRLGEYDLRFADLLPEEEWLDCGCLDRWRHGAEEETTADRLHSLGGQTPSSPVSDSSSDITRSRSSTSGPGMRR